MVLRGDAAAETTSVLLTKPLLAALCQRHRALHHCGDPDQFRTTGLTSVDFLNHQAQIDIGKCARTVRSPSHEKLLACDQPIKVAIMRRLRLYFVDWRNTWLPQSEHGRHISLKERPASYHHGQQKRRISEVMSDHSLSSQPCDPSHALINILRNMYILTK